MGRGSRIKEAADQRVEKSEDDEPETGKIPAPSHTLTIGIEGQANEKHNAHCADDDCRELPRHASSPFSRCSTPPGPSRFIANAGVLGGWRIIRQLRKPLLALITRISTSQLSVH